MSPTLNTLDDSRLLLSPLLEIDFAGFNCRNPFWVASGPPSSEWEKIKALDEAGVGAIIGKTCCLDASLIHNPASRTAVQMLGKTKIGLINTELISDKDINEWERIMELAVEQLQCLFIPSVMEEPRKDAWQEIAYRFVKRGAKVIKLNLSCGHGMPERGMGGAVGEVPEATFNTCSWVKEAVGDGIVVMAKMTGNGDIASVTRAVLDAHCIPAGINTIRALGGVDPKTGSPRPSNSGNGTRGSLSGPAIHWIACEKVATMAEIIRDEYDGAVPLVGIGGADSWDTCLNFLRYGAIAAEMCTAFMFRDPKELVRELSDGMLAYMVEHNYSRITEFVGASLPHVLGHSEHVKVHEQAKAKRQLV